MAQRDEAAQWLSNARALRQRVRLEAVPVWIPMLIFGCVICGAVPLYVADSQTSEAGFSFIGGVEGFGGMQPSWRVSLYWMLTVPGGYLSSAALLRSHAEKVGLRDRSMPFTATGLALFVALLLLYSPVGVQGTWGSTPGNLLVRGLLPLLVIAVALGSLAAIVRSVRIGIFAGAFLGLSLLVNLYNMENLAFRLGWTPSGDLQWRLSAHLGLLVCGVVLLVAAVLSLGARRRARGSSGQ